MLSVNEIVWTVEKGRQLRAQAEALEQKGFRKTAEDLVRIRELRREIREGVEKLAINGVVGMRTIPTLKQTGHIRNLETDSRNFASCDTEMFFGPWSREFVHGADAMLWPAALAEKILQSGERISCMQRATWRKPITHNLRMAVYSEGCAGHWGSDESSFDGTFVTTKGRRLEFKGCQNPALPINVVSGTTNSFARGTVSPCRNSGPQQCSFDLYPPAMPSDMQTLKESAPLRISTLVEMLSIALTQTDIVRHGENGRVLCEVRDMPVPEDLSPIFDLDAEQLQVRFLGPETRKRGKSGFIIIPLEYKFPGQDDFSSAAIALS